ncbi:iron-regulated protein [Pendulispora rubella]|uniref:Iron-regulated protein n=1 Tax=Pendulispora rubella TaxID=2741070 RepID=A0ABZ2LAG5_9BACT
MKIRLTSIGLAVALTLGTAIAACSSDDSPGAPPAGNDAGDSGKGDGGTGAVTAADVVKNYATIVHENYEDSIAQAKKLQTAVDAFLAAPSQATLDDARKAWTQARPSYGQSEAFRFYGGPIDADNTGPEGAINGWPLDEAYIDYVLKDPAHPEQGELKGGIINTNTGEAITKESIAAKNEQGGEKNLSTGWHAIEFLLWGQDLSTTGPGNRPYTDYVTGTGGTHDNQQRRRDYLKAAVDLLVDDLESVEVQWHTDTADTYASKFIAGDTNAALTSIIKGLGSLSGAELSKERMNNAYETKDQEEEHSCFSDTTLQDLTANAKGIENVYLGRYGNIDGAGLDDLVKAKDAALDAKVKQQLAASLDAIAAIPAPFDQAITNDAARPKVKAAIDSLGELTKSIVKVATTLGLTINIE